MASIREGRALLRIRLVFGSRTIEGRKLQAGSVNADDFGMLRAQDVDDVFEG